MGRKVNKANADARIKGAKDYYGFYSQDPDGLRPIKWCAPESLKVNGHCTKKSDGKPKSVT